MPCSYCNSQFSLTRWKSTCVKCCKKYCSGCIVERLCLSCHVVFSTEFNGNELLKVKTKHLRLFLNNRSFSTETIREKHELVSLILLHVGKSEADLGSHKGSYDTSRHSSVDPGNNVGEALSSGETQTNQFTSENNEAPIQTEAIPPFRDVLPPTYNETQSSFPTAQEFSSTASTSKTSTNDPESVPKKELPDISDITSAEEIKLLNVRQLKYLLTTNLVNFQGILEKPELIRRVENLFKEHQNEANLKSEDSSGQYQAAKDENLCKICWDSPVNCVYLECGHMVTCIDCSKEVKECPICRQNIVRTVRVFKS